MIRTNQNHEAAKVIDNQDQAKRLLRKPMEALPPSALATAALLANLRGRSSAAKITLNCTITKVFYLGDDGGITCHVIFDEEEKDEVFLVSITQLAFDRRLSVARDIAAYQKHRIKRIRSDNVTDAPPPITKKMEAAHLAPLGSAVSLAGPWQIPRPPAGASDYRG